MEEVQFVASLPEIQSAVSIGGGGARVKLDIPESDLAGAIKLAAYGQGKLLRVTVEIEAGGGS